MTGTYPAPSLITLREGERFSYKGLVYAVDEANPITQRYTLYASFKRKAVMPDRAFNWSMRFVSHLLHTGQAVRNPVDRCDHCGEPFREGARFGDGDQQCEIVINGEHKLVHVECGIAAAAEQGKIIDEILA